MGIVWWENLFQMDNVDDVGIYDDNNFVCDAMTRY